MWLHKFSAVIVSHSMTQMNGKQSSAKTSYLNAINSNEFIKNEWKWDAERTEKKQPQTQTESQRGKKKKHNQKDSHNETCALIKSAGEKNTHSSSMPKKIIALGLTSCQQIYCLKSQRQRQQIQTTYNIYISYQISVDVFWELNLFA